MRRGRRGGVGQWGVYHSVVRQGVEDEGLAYEERAEERVLAYEDGQFARRRTCSRCASARASAAGAYASECGRQQWVRASECGRQQGVRSSECRRGQGAASCGQPWVRVCRADSRGCTHGLCARRRALIVNGQRRANGVSMEGCLANRSAGRMDARVRWCQACVWCRSAVCRIGPDGRMDARRALGGQVGQTHGGGRPLVGSGQTDAWTRSGNKSV